MLRALTSGIPLPLVPHTADVGIQTVFFFSLFIFYTEIYDSFPALSLERPSERVRLYLVDFLDSSSFLRGYCYGVDLYETEFILLTYLLFFKKMCII